MNVIMKDVADKRWLRTGYGRKWTEQDEQAIDGAFLTGLKYIGCILALIFAISTLANAEPAKVAITTVKDRSLINAKLSKTDRKLLVGPQMKSYEKRVIHARVNDLWSIQ